jgi:hypothetical protein
MTKRIKFLLATATMTTGLLTAGGLATKAHAQEPVQQTTTTRETTTNADGTGSMTRESTTTTTAPAGPLGAPMPGYTDFGYAPDNYAAHHGYNDGYDKGISDHNTGHSYRPTSDHYYNHPIGYNGGPISQKDYDRIYKEAFLHGYERGYRKADK